MLRAKGLHSFRAATVPRKNISSPAAPGAGLAAAFNAPLAGVLFALEEVHRNFNPKVLLSAMAAAITADVVSKLFSAWRTFAVAPVQLLPLSYYLLLIAFGRGARPVRRFL